ncbi:MAG: hypothetical protein M0R80_31725 [Proteobacteria bacterium]|nr:hypothetical protein [Pseudomonadota bacterium]
MSKRWCVAVVGLALAVAFAGPAEAQKKKKDKAAETAEEKAEREARAAFQEAVEKFDSGGYEGAVTLFRKAYELNPSWKLLYNVGQCEAALKRHGEALEAFEQYLSQGGDEIEVTRRGEVLAEVERLRKMSGSIEISAPAGALVLVDGVERGRAPLPGRIRVAAGVDHAVRVELGGELLADRAVRVGGEENLLVDANPRLPEPVAAEDGKAIRDRKIRTAGWIAVGVGAAALVGGAVTGGLALSANKSIQDACAGGQCPANQRDDIDRRDALALTTDVLIPAGAAIAVTGAVLLIVFRDKERADGDAVAFSPIVTADGAGAVAAWRF